MRQLLLAAFVAVAATQSAPAANAACAETRGKTVHVHSGQCPRPGCALDGCPPVLDLCVVQNIYTTLGVGFECD